MTRLAEPTVWYAGQVMTIDAYVSARLDQDPSIDLDDAAQDFADLWASQGEQPVRMWP